MRISETGKLIPSNRGFTLLELIIIIVIVGITLGYIGPRLYTGISSSSMDKATRDILTLIQFARSSAVTQHKPYYVRFDIDNGSVGLYPKQESSGVIPEMVKEKDLPKGIVFKNIKSPYQLPKQQGQMDILVTPEGVIEQGVIYIEGGFGKTYTLVIKPFSGNLKVYDRYVEVTYG
ncbi:MAG TPA: prepilin-type N-terminal cleavage/methylation domain-containing protein [Deltaproteobacteria bacterium]|nr:prepilin-type N-terminal cleavage/methylation domain-containing protein [Deltaproteobacteria bacterium]HPR50704.1 prepilin-type N-terminal cleavage/methylation domain-containing protein [Deltaproteobacteria bacterium]